MDMAIHVALSLALSRAGVTVVTRLLPKEGGMHHKNTCNVSLRDARTLKSRQSDVEKWQNT